MKKVLVIGIVAVILIASASAAVWYFFFKEPNYSVRDYDGYYMDLRGANSLALVDENVSSSSTSSSAPKIITHDDQSSLITVNDVSEDDSYLLYKQTIKGDLEKILISKDKDNFDNAEEFDCGVENIQKRGNFLFMFVGNVRPYESTFDGWNKAMFQQFGFIPSSIIYLVSLDSGRIFNITSLFHIVSDQYLIGDNNSTDDTYYHHYLLEMYPLSYKDNEMTVVFEWYNELLPDVYAKSVVGKLDPAKNQNSLPLGVYRMAVNDNELLLSPILPTNLNSVKIIGITHNGIIVGDDGVNKFWYSMESNDRLAYDQNYDLFDGYLCKDLIFDGMLPVSCTRLNSDGTTEPMVYGYEDLKQYIKKYDDALLFYEETDSGFRATYCQTTYCVELVSVSVNNELDNEQNTKEVKGSSIMLPSSYGHPAYYNGCCNVTLNKAKVSDNRLIEYTSCFTDTTYYGNKERIWVRDSFDYYLSQNYIYWMDNNSVKYFDMETWETGNISGGFSSFTKLYADGGVIRVTGISDKLAEVTGVISGTAVDLSYKEPEYRIVIIYSLN